ncbi:MAG: hypothetical protein JW854_11800 [Actinobacteria bacterium]|nr:hypothetical protein [Actinomycetota bacterium]
MRYCHECGLPKRITQTHSWLGNGTMVEAKNPSHRMIFIESENIAGVFTRVEEILGISIERLIVESQSRLTCDYVGNLLPGILLKVLRMTSIKPLAKSITNLGRITGLGDVELLSMRIKGSKGDYVKIGGRNIFYLPSYCGMVMGAMEAVSGQECSIDYEETSPGYYEVTTHVSTHPIELRERFQWPEYAGKTGDITPERCSRCGGPKELSAYEWKMGDGMIVRRSDGRRMLIDGPAETDAIFIELEKELGEDIPRVVIAAQRDYVKSGSHSAEEARDLDTFRSALAFRGLGNLRELDWGEGSLRLCIENPCMHLLLVGLAQGLFELATGRDSEVDWELAGDGDLCVEVSAL